MGFRNLQEKLENLIALVFRIVFLHIFATNHKKYLLIETPKSFSTMTKDPSFGIRLAWHPALLSANNRARALKPAGYAD